MEEEIKERLQKKENWLHGFYMIFFMFIFGWANAIVGIIAFFQYATLIITGDKNAFLLEFSKNLGTYIHQIIAFLSFNSSQRPFPFQEWPQQHTHQATTDHQQLND